MLLKTYQYKHFLPWVIFLPPIHRRHIGKKIIITDRPSSLLMNTDTFLTLFLLKFQIPHKHVLSPSRTRDHHFQPISVLGYVRQTEVLNLTLSIPADMRITSCLCLPWNPRLNWHLNLSLPNFFASFSNGCSHLKHFPSTFPRDLWVQSLYWLGPILVTMSKA